MPVDSIKKTRNSRIADITLERLPPQNIEAEMAVLGSMLLEEDAIAQAIEALDESYFYKEAHKKIFSALVTLFDKNKAADLVTLVDELKRRGQLDEAGGPAYLASLANVVPTAANIRHYAKIVKEKAILRNLISTATQIVTESYEAGNDSDCLIDKAERMIFEITSRKIETRLVPLKEIIKDSIETIDNLYQKKAHVTGVPTGFFDLDALTAGLQASDLIIVAGRPSMGKSAFMGSIAEHLGIVEKIPLAIFSLEMSKEQLVQRMLCSHARIDAHRVRTGFLAQQDWPKLTAAAGKLSEAPIYIDDSPSISVLELRAKARRLKAQYDIKMIIVDYMQLMQGRSGAENRQQEISEISKSLKALARELKLPLIAVSQLSRAVEGRSDHRPQLSDLRESGAIEQDADVVILLLREEYYSPSEENKGIAEVIIAKQRNGPVGSIRLAFIREYARFDSLSRSEED
ncbi:MAG: replicative DNA helicase [Candidatus Omnitrophica bacterium CG12_big_fil_rev_8_21_14_0_65_43_15]|uniref:Replicative DNA helicase n=1 Tax=Candidatus Taenaricola geysiri TaxID=1974752 RepID=A0A2J0LSV0_9BACT|nr:MAG: replicative DNA helicase [Candidatus Omnitrophica bacterium CG1_02_43_210]PIR66036.1 MAG: replicative DNA helicase [Candidatus Omnitrophica bacterium CG10_big_fil_rev_8_21_14_0_10_43_8]PIV11722.1 MAG: replicative DNA helicase [Candidatus Omnitrophica bacterium CG03_land_8_20_14_0_80_43_22]PIW66897.1 MAG: replicative DNA helicase [Candidatus Omnitrophica bacterium CG12_big_fil_rev_8_21_14_0_65_43_15]PIW80637.1 MAG: replicative DNA helicase [Candidatus Omnitrophica bacterium CG_4_8_14_3_u